MANENVVLSLGDACLSGTPHSQVFQIPPCFTHDHEQDWQITAFALQP